jgi:hypothetical protein
MSSALATRAAYLRRPRAVPLPRDQQLGQPEHGGGALQSMVLGWMFVPVHFTLQSDVEQSSLVPAPHAVSAPLHSSAHGPVPQVITALLQASTLSQITVQE